MIDKIKKYIRSLEKEAIPQLSVNCVIFGFHEKTLKVIVNKIALGQSTMFVLPGGYVKQTENLTDAVQRIVKESTGLEKILFKQFAVFGDASRSFEKEFKVLRTSKLDGDAEVLKWFSKRFISVCYLALVDFSKIELKPTQFLDAAQWLSVEKAKTLAMDHSHIVESARESLIKELPYAPIASNLLPPKFTLPDLHALVEGILGRTIDRPNFRRKILKSDMIVKVGQDNSNKRRPADLYAFRHGKKTSLIDEYKLGF
ncbi:NUDIX domain-containing protein [Chryseolinea sp. H1M3-3]|uniref:NUDIX hydrolase n=1 Tax=Chryseolinea sp. H1M3-3 TaxID=3034144 RepID=UPI0023EAD752|nr:NUDIX domain-containing protein [Chryseolinea sp. H1M3-3]